MAETGDDEVGGKKNCDWLVVLPQQPHAQLQYSLEASLKYAEEIEQDLGVISQHED
jgi:hypothetical protein